MYIGIDVGTTVLKGAVFSGATGALRAQAAQRLPVTVTAEGGREQDPLLIAVAVGELLAQLRAQVGTDWASIQGIGLAAQGGSTVMVERETGQPACPLYLWNDARAYPYLSRVTAATPEDFWRSFSLCNNPGMGLARILWLRERQPELLDEQYIYSGAGEFIYHQLTGAWVQDACNALQIGCYDAVHEKLISAPLALVGAPLSLVSPLRAGHETHPLSAAAAQRFGLRAGIPVAGPYNDHEAAFCASASTAKQPLQCSLGTAWVGNFIQPTETPGGSFIQLPIPSPVGTGRLIILPLLTGNVTWDWALATFVDPDHRRALAAQADIFTRRLLPPYGVVALPWLNRPNIYDDTANGAGCLLGLSPATEREDLLRAVAAGMVYELRRVFAEVIAHRAVETVLLSGGASKGRQFQQLILSLFSPLPVLQVTEEDWLGARGSLYAFGTAACQAEIRPLELQPDTDTDAIQQAFTLYNESFARVYGHLPAAEAFRFAP